MALETHILLQRFCDNAGVPPSAISMSRFDGGRPTDSRSSSLSSERSYKVAEPERDESKLARLSERGGILSSSKPVASSIFEPDPPPPEGGRSPISADRSVVGAFKVDGAATVDVALGVPPSSCDPSISSFQVGMPQRTVALRLNEEYSFCIAFFRLRAGLIMDHRRFLELPR